jgi:GTPase SAR1 family protein
MKKIIFIGPPSAGKTSVRLYFFENTPITEILKPLNVEPTMGINWFNYELYDTKLGIVDSSGQEIWSLLAEENGYLFIGADIVIFMFDVTQFNGSELLRLEFMNYLKEIIARREVLEENYEIHVFVHKIDLVERDQQDKIKTEISGHIFSVLKEKFSSDAQIKIHFTSLNPVLVDETYALLKKIIKGY